MSLHTPSLSFCYRSRWARTDAAFYIDLVFCNQLLTIVSFIVNEDVAWRRTLCLTIPGECSAFVMNRESTSAQWRQKAKRCTGLWIQIPFLCVSTLSKIPKGEWRSSNLFLVQRSSWWLFSFFFQWKSSLDLKGTYGYPLSLGLKLKQRRRLSYEIDSCGKQFLSLREDGRWCFGDERKAFGCRDRDCRVWFFGRLLRLR